MLSGWRRAAAVLNVAAVLTAATLAACGGPAEGPDEPARPRWREVSLPLPDGAPGRLLPRDATYCEGRWYLVGAVAGPDGATTPAAWTSPDARGWTPVTLFPKSFYGRQNVLYTAACRGGRLAAVGGKVGGAHGNPRVSSWHQRDDGSLDEVVAGFELYGGPYAVNVARLVAGPAGWLIVGNRTSGAAVWTSPDSAGFTIVEAAPELASDARGESWAFDAVAADGGWLAVGGLIRAGRPDRDPLAWTSADGATWARVDVPATGEFEEFQRVVLAADGTPVALGLRGRVFGAWRREAGAWVAAARFGAASGKGVPAVRGLVVVDGADGPAGLLAVTSYGPDHALWFSTDGGRSWGAVRPPAALPAGADRAATVAARDGLTLLLADAGRHGRVWVSEGPFVGPAGG